MFSLLGFRFTAINQERNLFGMDAVLNDRTMLYDEAYNQAMMEDSIAIRILQGTGGEVHMPKLILTQAPER